jgi:hypothetical protein
MTQYSPTANSVKDHVYWRQFVGKRVIHHRVSPDRMERGKWIDKVEDREVRLMTVVQCWAMVRYPHCMPYVCHIQELREHKP